MKTKFTNLLLYSLLGLIIASNTISPSRNIDKKVIPYKTQIFYDSKKIEKKREENINKIINYIKKGNHKESIYYQKNNKIIIGYIKKQNKIIINYNNKVFIDVGADSKVDYPKGAQKEYEYLLTKVYLNRK